GRDRPADADAARRRDDFAVGKKDEQMPGGARGHEDGWNRRGDRGDSEREGVSRSGRAAGAGGIARHAGALRADTGRGVSAERAKGVRGGERAGAFLAFSRKKQKLQNETPVCG